MLRIALVCLAAFVLSCSNTTVPPSILETVDCTPEQRNPLTGAHSVWEDAIAAYEASDAENPPDPGSIVFVGSSSIVFWQSLADDMAPLRVVNRGFGGSVMPHATHFADRIVLPYEPQAIVLYEGDNDIAFETSADCVLEDLEVFIEKIHSEQPGVPIYVLAVKPSIARAELWPEMDRAHQLMAALAETNPDVHFIDVATPMFGESGALREDLFIGDGLHMNAKGYEVWTATVRPVLIEDFS